MAAETISPALALHQAGREAVHKPHTRYSSDTRQAIVDLLPMAESLGDISRALGMPRDTVKSIARPHIAVMRAAGTLGQCVCGRDKFHPRGCSCLLGGDTASRMSRNTAIQNSPKLLKRRADMIAEIMTGDTFPAIAKRLGVGVKSMRHYMMYLTPAQRERRKALERGRANGRQKAPSYRPRGDALYRQIAAAVPKWLDAHLHDDVISEVYLAILDGSIAQGDVRDNAERFARAARNAFTSKWGTRSLDEKCFEDGDATLGSMIPDPSALAAFDYIFEDVL